MVFLLVCWWDLCVLWFVDEYWLLWCIGVLIVFFDVFDGLCLVDDWFDVLDDIVVCVYCCVLWMVVVVGIGWFVLMGFECGVMVLLMVCDVDVVCYCVVFEYVCFDLLGVFVDVNVWCCVMFVVVVCGEIV